MTKTGGRQGNIISFFWRILTKFAKFLLSDKRKMAFLAAKFFGTYLS